MFRKVYLLIRKGSASMWRVTNVPRNANPYSKETGSTLVTREWGCTGMQFRQEFIRRLSCQQERGSEIPVSSSIKGEMMRKSIIATAAVALMVAMVGVSPASAYKFSPEGATANATIAGSLTIRNPKGGYHSWTCTGGTMPGKITSGQIVGSGLQPTGCSDLGNPYGVKPSGTWQVTATSLTTANLTADTVPSGGTVLTLENGSPAICTATVKGPITLKNLPWSNSLHQLKLTPAAGELPTSTTPPGPACGIPFTPGITLEGTLQYTALITAVS
jgi:hypothetical protein